jgi:2-methylcitrate dehydratase PrpD
MTPIDFAHELGFGDLPKAVIIQSRRCLQDLVGVAAAGATTELARIVRSFDGRRASAAGAAFAGASLIDAFDAHDGHALTKGHAGVAVLPTLLALGDAEEAVDGRELLTALVIGYELATRAGMALHATATDYHTSGAWNALACAFLTARRLGLTRTQTREAIGIAEYHGPRSQMMRCIDHPTMVKDGSGWGAFAGVSAGYLAADGFTGAPAVLVDDPAVAGLWADLGSRWRILEQYCKPYPVCRWAQPAVEAARDLRDRHELAPAAIDTVVIESFAEAVRLAGAAPKTTEEAQYALAFPVAAMLCRGRVGPEEITGAALADTEILNLSRCIRLVVAPEFAERFPAERFARVTIHLKDGTRLTSPATPARGDPSAPLSEDMLLDKFQGLTSMLGRDRGDRILSLIEGLAEGGGSTELAAELTRPF